jgi:hypothetical protein
MGGVLCGQAFGENQGCLNVRFDKPDVFPKRLKINFRFHCSLCELAASLFAALYREVPHAEHENDFSRSAKVVIMLRMMSLSRTTAIVPIIHCEIT